MRKKDLAKEYMEYDNMFLEYWLEEKMDEIDAAHIGNHALLEIDISTDVLYGSYEKAKGLVNQYFEYQSIVMFAQSELNKIKKDLIGVYMNEHGYEKDENGYWKYIIQH